MVQWVKQISDTLLLSIKKAENATSKRHKGTERRNTTKILISYQSNISKMSLAFFVVCVCVYLPPTLRPLFLTISQIFNDQIMSSLRAPYPFIFHSTFSALVFFLLVHTKTQQYQTRSLFLWCLISRDLFHCQKMDDAMLLALACLPD